MTQKKQFTTKCFIRKNTPELRAKLEELGYINGAWESPHLEYPYLHCCPNQTGLFKGDGFYITEDDIKCDGHVYRYNPPQDTVDCGNNEKLFLALAALRSDSDIRQWFTDGEDWQMSYTDDWLDYDEDEVLWEYDPVRYHKATVDELITHFNKHSRI